MLLYGGGQIVWFGTGSLPPPPPSSSTHPHLSSAPARDADTRSDDPEFTALRTTDIVLMQAGVHGSPQATFQRPASLWRAVRRAELRPNDRPTLIYITTPQEAFRTALGVRERLSRVALAVGGSAGTTASGERGVGSEGNGAYDPAFLAAETAAVHGETPQCEARVRPTRAEAEWDYLHTHRLGNESMLESLHGVISLEGIETLGDLKVAGGVGSFGDCVHYCMPGVPDVLALAVYTMLLSVPRLSAAAPPLARAPILQGWPGAHEQA